MRIFIVAYDLSNESSLLYDRAKKAVTEKLHADSPSEIVPIMLRMLVIWLLVPLIKTGLLRRWDMILLSKLDHHANIVPWQIISEEYGINIDWIWLNPDGTLDYVDLENKLKWVTLVSLTGASNVTGEILDLDKLSYLLGQCEKRPLCVIDGSQRFPHMETDVKKYWIDIFFATGHKVMSDTGIGFFYAQKTPQDDDSSTLRLMSHQFCYYSRIWASMTPISTWTRDSAYCMSCFSSRSTELYWYNWMIQSSWILWEGTHWICTFTVWEAPFLNTTSRIKELS